MTNGRSTPRPLIFAVVVLVALPAFTLAQDVPQTPWSAPDLQGVWDFRTITPLQRPEDLGDKEFLTDEEAANLEQEAVERDNRLPNESARRTESGGNVGAYNNFWDGPRDEHRWRSAHVADRGSAERADSDRDGDRAGEGGHRPRLLQRRPRRVTREPEQRRSMHHGIQCGTAHHAGVATTRTCSSFRRPTTSYC